MINYYLHKIKAESEISYPLLDEHGYISMMAEFFDEKLYKIVENQDNNSFKNHVYEQWGVVPRSVWFVWRFLNFKKGDYIVVPKWGGIFSIYKIIGDKFLGRNDLDRIIKSLDTYKSKEKDYDYGIHVFWKVKPLVENLSKSEYADALLTRRMLYRGTNIDCNDIKDSIDKAIKGFNEKKPINLFSDIIDNCCDNILKLIKEKLNPAKFEKLIGLYFKQCGANEVYKPSKTDNSEGDCDVDALFESIKTIIHVQAKFYEGTAGKWAIEQINDFIDNKPEDDGYIHIGWVISTCDDFSEEAKLKAAENNILLINGKSFAEMLIKAGISSLDRSI